MTGFAVSYYISFVDKKQEYSVTCLLSRGPYRNKRTQRRLTSSNGVVVRLSLVLPPVVGAPITSVPSFSSVVAVECLAIKLDGTVRDSA